MGVFSSSDFDFHEEVLFLNEVDARLRAIIAIHNTNRGPAIGGCRMMEYPSEDQGLRDVLRLARAMSYKAAAADVPFGGGKCVVFGHPRSDKTPAMMRALGRAIAKMNGRFFIGEDVGTSAQDMAELRREAPTVLGVPSEMGGSGDPGPWTARGCLAGIRAAAARRWGDRDLRGLRVAVQGLGHVGWELCRLLAPLGAVLLVTDIRPEPVGRAIEALGAQAVEPEEIYDAEADIFAPCALGGVINDETLGRLRAAVVAGSANNQLQRERHDAALQDRGILYVPDYVMNAGGMIRFVGEILDWDVDRIGHKIDAIESTVAEVFERSGARSIPTGAAANEIAEARIQQAS